MNATRNRGYGNPTSMVAKMARCIDQAAATHTLRSLGPMSATGAASSITTDNAAIGGSNHALRTTTPAIGDPQPPSRSRRTAE